MIPAFKKKSMNVKTIYLGMQQINMEKINYNNRLFD
jgi:hypothetical protein